MFSFARIYESFRLGLDSIRANPTRSSLTVLGVTVGVGVVVMVAALLQGAQNFIVAATAEFAPDVIRIEKAAFQDFGFGGQEFVEAQSKRPDILPDDIAFLTERLGPGYDVGAQAEASLPARRGAKTLVGVAVQGVTYNISTLTNLRIAYGREITKTDDEFRRNVCVIGQDVVDELFGGDNPVGKEIRLGQLPFQVIGVAESRGSLFGNSQDAFVLVPLGTFTRIFGERSRSIAALVKPVDPGAVSQPEAEEQIRVAMRIRHKLGNSAEDDFSIVTAKSVQAFSGNLTGIVGTIIYPLTVIALFVGGVVVMNMMLASVTERTREIGVRIAIGATRSDILTQFLIETTSLTLIGGLVGVAGAAALSALINLFSGFPIAVPLWAVLLAVGVSCLVGIVFGVVPARKAAQLDPIEALRAE